MKAFRLILGLLVVFSTFSCSKSCILQTQEIKINQWKLTVEIADTPETQEKGLMGRESMTEDHGMLFVYDRDSRKSFWMKSSALDSRYSVRYALEVNQGAFQRHGIKEGDKVEFIRP